MDPNESTEVKRKVTKQVNYGRDKAAYLLALAIIILILALLPYCPVFKARHKLSLFDDIPCEAAAIGTISLDCNDFNPCTVDVKEPLNAGCGSLTFTPDGSSDSACQLYQCKHYPISSGSCCEDTDTCYTSDPGSKHCFYGTCKSPNPALCKGYCDIDSDCDAYPIPILVSDLFAFHFCAFHSCVTLVSGVFGPSPDPYSLMNSSTMELKNITSCIDAVCYTPMLGSGHLSMTCYYTYKCAPYLNKTLPPFPPPTESPTDSSRRRRVLNEQSEHNRSLFSIHAPRLSLNDQHLLSLLLHEKALEAQEKWESSHHGIVNSE